MTCWHYLLRRKFIAYLEGGLTGHALKKIERHLLDCEPCRRLFVRLRTGHQWAQRLERLVPARVERPEFAALMASVGSARRPWRAGWQDWIERLATPRVVTILAALVVLQWALLVVSSRGVMLGKHNPAVLEASGLDLEDFRQVSIGELPSNTQPHVATEGYVYDVHRDPEEGTVAFKLAESASTSKQFVVCEIMTPMTSPRNGEHVRVYGVARYDAQTSRRWYEVNPVLSISTLK